ncbi:MAG TPA: phosphate signaling complex protein PhoU [Anaeromyxobacter sp.]|nr:phosphate signaling complex protein PhoU [Anaeromyxobacter sp.]
MPTHTDKEFERELVELRNRILEMGGLVEAAIANGVRAVIQRDAALARQVKIKDREINRIEMEVDRACLRLLALRQPAGSDLRFITTALKIVTDLERMGDLAKDVAKRAIELAQSPQAPALRPMHDLTRLADLCEAQLKLALDAFVTLDVDKADQVLHGDFALDATYHNIFNSLLASMMEDPRVIRRATAVLFAAKHLERFGDHAVNLAEMVVYMVRGIDIRHPASRAVEAEKTAPT